jgi:hypothetical protein
MRYALVTPSTDVSGIPYVLLEGDYGIFGIMAPDSRFAAHLNNELLVSKRDTIEKATTGMSYHSVSTNVLDEKNITLLRQLAKKWKTTLPAEIAEPEEPKESANNE